MNKVGLWGLLSVVALALNGCAAKDASIKQASVQEAPPMQQQTAPITVPMINTKGDKIGTAQLTQMKDGVIVKIDASHLPPGKHGFHFHERGLCEAPDFKTSGAHVNPEGKKHGFDNPQGPHDGDLPNLEVGAGGTVNAQFLTKLVTLEKGKPNSLLKEGGAALVIHEGPDDYKTDPAGNSGARIACGVIK